MCIRLPEISRSQLLEKAAAGGESLQNLAVAFEELAQLQLHREGAARAIVRAACGQSGLCEREAAEARASSVDLTRERRPLVQQCVDCLLELFDTCPPGGSHCP